MKRCHHDPVKAAQIQVTQQMTAEIKMAPLLPKALLSGSVSQHPIKEQQSYGTGQMDCC
jgi:hypothetical protein